MNWSKSKESVYPGAQQDTVLPLAEAANPAESFSLIRHIEIRIACFRRRTLRQFAGQKQAEFVLYYQSKGTIPAKMTAEQRIHPPEYRCCKSTHQHKTRVCINWFGRNYGEFASSPDYCSVPVYDRGHDNCCRECCRRLLAIRSQFFSRIGWVNYEFEMRGRIQTGHPATLLNVSK